MGENRVKIWVLIPVAVCLLRALSPAPTKHTSTTLDYKVQGSVLCFFETFLWDTYTRLNGAKYGFRKTDIIGALRENELHAPKNAGVA